jgi:hypothetical protein
MIAMPIRILIVDDQGAPSNTEVEPGVILDLVTTEPRASGLHSGRRLCVQPGSTLG